MVMSTKTQRPEDKCLCCDGRHPAAPPCALSNAESDTSPPRPPCTAQPSPTSPLYNHRAGLPAVHGEQAPRDAIKGSLPQAEAPPTAPPPQPTAELHLAAAAGDEQRLHALLAQGAPLELADSNGERALHAAASSGQAGCLRWLLAAGADMEAADAHGHTALHWAAAAGQEGCLRALVERGAQLEQRDDNGLTPLALAAVNNQLVRLT